MSEVVEALRAFADPDGRIPLPMLDDKGRMVGIARRTPEEMTRVEVHVAESGTVSAPPTAYAYVAVCRALHEQAARLEQLERELAEAVAAERERCAWIAERASEARAFEATLCDDRAFVGARLEAADIAAAIRNGEREE